MPLRESKGNMYDWVHKQRYNFIGGECPHQCKYCYVKSLHYPTTKERYSGKIRLLESEFKKPLKADKPIFIGSCFDMWADAVPDDFILKTLYHLRKFDNQYVFQTKTPQRFVEFVSMLHKSDVLGTTIETNNYELIKKMSNAPGALNRAKMLSLLLDNERFVTIEPVVDFHLENLITIIRIAEPAFVNIGADSKHHNLLEPSWNKIQLLITELKKFTEVRCKNNLERLRKYEGDNDDS